MKTLAEVIKAFDNSCFKCGECPYCEDKYCRNEMDNDALHYLKAYQWQMTNPDGDHLQLEKCRALLSEFYRNDPLSWDELRTMEGKPVWVEVLDDNGDHYKWRGDGWYIVKDFTQGYYGGYCHLEPNWRTWTEQTYGDLWQAYKRER